MKRDRTTKQALERVACRMFAERGYEGVSIADIAGEIGITKQALLHHFGSKEQLYGKVLESLSIRFDEIVSKHLAKEAPASEQFLAIIGDLYRHMNTQKQDARLIMRELLDNKPRIERKQKWYLRPFLDSLTDLIQQIPEARTTNRTEALTRTFQLLGAMNYFAVSDPTLKKMYGPEVYRDVEGVFLEQLQRQFIPR